MKTVKKVDPKLMKKMNKQLILRYLIEHGPTSRTELVSKTGLASSAVWRMVDELVEEGFVEQKEYFARTNTKKAAVYGIARNFVTSLLMDVQVLQTTVALGFLDGSCKILETFPTGSFDDFSKRIRSFLSEKTLNELFGKGENIRVIFSLPGIVDTIKRVLLYAPNLNWHDIDFKEAFARKSNVEVIVENDSNLSLLAESFYARDIKNSSNAFFLYLGEGVGGAIFINGRIVIGSSFAAGEIGHTLIQLNGTLTEVEKLLSISKLVDEFESRKNLERVGTLRERFVRLQRAWLSSDEVAKELIQEFIKNLAIVIRNVGYTLNPEIIVFGGSVSNLWETFGASLQREIIRLDEYGFLKNTLFRDTLFKETSASLLGCNVLAINKFLEDMMC
ncbi:ROK family transcriptional regulator [Thermotoga caldifontis]|uniref:ROK family transcriptional regulator n=1 Tax=Thermotoga caldifontis TaxID=1508419 RepID=UPI000596EA3C|nr:ROK family transcriptional regulator [Thermotoga caldifontis]